MESYRALQFFDEVRLWLKAGSKTPSERSFGSEISNLRASINTKIERVLDTSVPIKPSIENLS